MHTYRTTSNFATGPVSGSGNSGNRNDSERGVALIITLLLLSMVMALSVGMVIAMSSETLIGGYYRNYRGSFYAADSGANIAVQYMESQIAAGIPTTFTAPPLTTAQAQTLATNTIAALASAYGSSTSLNAGDAAQSWNESFKITNSTLALVGTPTPTSYNTTVCNAPGPPANGYAYQFTYSVTSVGSAQGSEQQSVTETGNINLGVTGQATTSCVSFAYFGAFIDYYQPGIGPLVPGTMTGPMFTNTAWEFMAAIPPWTAPYIFTDPVGQVDSQVDYWDSGWGQHWSSATSYGSGANLVAPDFEEGLQLNQTPIPLPTNSFNQVESVIDGNGTLYQSAPTNAQLAQLTNTSSQPLTTTTSTGVFMNQGTTATACGTKPTPCIAGGGFYVQGQADLQLIPVSGSSTAQEYIITQNGTSTTIVVDPAANGGTGSTVITQGTNSLTLNGVPMDTITAQPSTMVYVEGNVTIHGPGEGQGAVQDNAMITVTANANAALGQSGDIIATGDVLYKTEPVTIPADTLISSVTNMNQVLGLYTATGNFITQDTQADQNIEVDGSIATISTSDSANNCSSGKGGQLSYGHINTFNNVGGMIQSCIYAADVDTENTWFDRRFTARPNFAPPWFPSTTITQGGPLPTNVTPSIQRTQWLSTSSQ
jgi:Tfp pilus assembly protein PilX